jgi:hypothetical protein
LLAAWPHSLFQYRSKNAVVKYFVANASYPPLWASLRIHPKHVPSAAFHVFKPTVIHLIRTPTMPVEQQIFVLPFPLPLFRCTMTSRDNLFFTLPKEFSIVKCFMQS